MYSEETGLPSGARSCARRGCSRLASICALVACVVMHASASAQEPVKYSTGVAYRGINRAGYEYGDYWTAEVNGWGGPTWFANPSAAEITAELTYFKSTGMNVIRLPISWERLQHTLNGPLTPSYLESVHRYVDVASSLQMSVVIDLHNYNRYAVNTHDANGEQITGFTQHVLGDGTVEIAHLVDVWVKLTNEFLDKPSVILGLMNEPHDFPMDSAAWFAAVQTVIDAIRATGSTQLILVPNTWGSDVTHWETESPNGSGIDSVAALVVTDSANNYAFDVHQYAGGNATGASYVALMTPITQWAETNSKRLFLSEFGVPMNAVDGADAIGGLLAYMNEHSSVWLGWTPWNLEPYWLSMPPYTADGPEMPWYAPHLDPSVFDAAVPPVVPSLSAEMQQMLDAHNADRANHCAPALTWDAALAAEAEAWATLCTAQHSSAAGAYGENLYYGWPSASATQAEDWWYDEISSYDFANPGFSTTTGHFTQVVWRGSMRLGCGKASCPNLDPSGQSAEYWVCRYAPPGNNTNPGEFQANVLPVTEAASCPGAVPELGDPDTASNTMLQ